MKLLSKYPFNFRNLIYGRSTVNIGDSFYAVALTLGLVSVYKIDASNLSLFVLIGMLPSMLGVLYGPILEKFKDVKFWLVVFQVLHLILVVSIIWGLYFKVNVIYIYLYNFLFSLVTCFINAIQMQITPTSLNNDEELINKSVDIQYFASNSLDILSNFVASLLLGIISYLTLLNVSIPFFIGGIYFMYRLKISSNQSQFIENTSEDSEVVETNNAGIKDNLRTFFSKRQPSQIVIIEACLSGVTDLLMTLAPLYLVSLHINIKWLGLVLATQRGADFLGALLAPKVKIKHTDFFCIDYMFSGLAFLLIFIIPNQYIKLILLFIGFVLVGISGNVFEKMMYKEYADTNISVIYTIISSFYSVFGIIFMLIPQVYSNIKVLGVILNIFTILCGIAIFIQKLNNEKKQ